MLAKGKKCNKCHETKILKEFNLSKESLDGRKSWCKSCTSERNKEWFRKLKIERPDKYVLRKRRHEEKIAIEKRNHPEEYRQKMVFYRKKYKEKTSAYNKRYWAAHKEKYSVPADKRRKKNPERARELATLRKMRWKLKNPEKVRETRKAHYQKMYATAKGKLNSRMSTGIRKAIKVNKKRRSWESLVGYTLSELKKHIEKNFAEGMSWENMDKWDIDHVIPVSAFNFTRAEDVDFKHCWSLKNLRPLWRKQNISKRDKLEIPFQPALL